MVRTAEAGFFKGMTSGLVKESRGRAHPVDTDSYDSMPFTSLVPGLIHRKSRTFPVKPPFIGILTGILFEPVHLTNTTLQGEWGEREERG